MVATIATKPTRIMPTGAAHVWNGTVYVITYPFVIVLVVSVIVSSLSRFDTTPRLKFIFGFPNIFPYITLPLPIRTSRLKSSSVLQWNANAPFP
jgi:hypothetical protein